MLPALSGRHPLCGMKTGCDRSFLSDLLQHLSIQQPDVPGDVGLPCQMCQAFRTHPASPRAHRDYYLTLAFPASASPEDYRQRGSTMSIQFKVWEPGAHCPSGDLFSQGNCFLKGPVRTFTSPVAMTAWNWREGFCGTLSVPCFFGFWFFSLGSPISLGGKVESAALTPIIDEEWETQRGTK